MSKNKETLKITPKPIEKELVLQDYKKPTPRKEIEIIVPPFLQEAGKRYGK